MQDSLASGKKFRTLNVIDDFNREALSIVIDTSLSSKRVIRELSQLIEWRGAPQQIRVDNGPEFIAYALAEWCEEQGIHLNFIQPGKPSQNGFVERFNRSYREEILDAHWFTSLEEVRQLTHQWIGIYNHDRPHEALGNLSPRRFLLKYGKVGDDFPTFQQDQFYQFSLFSTVAEQG